VEFFVQQKQQDNKENKAEAGPLVNGIFLVL
jgi:hypothetical protein